MSSIPKLLIRPLALAVCMLTAVSVSAVPEASSPREIAPFELGLTLSQVEREDGFHTLLITADRGAEVQAIDLSAQLQIPQANPFEVVAALGDERLKALYDDREHLLQLYPRQQLGIRNVIAATHIAAGANYADHAEESDIGEVFVYPKYAEPTGNETPMAYRKDGLLDYEVEICSIFDRDIASMEDFKSARKGIFLCGDFTDRATLARKVDIDDVESGVGFTDAKSGATRFPVGPYLVVPQQWREFVGKIEIDLQLNGEQRQHAMGESMILKLDELVAFSLRDSQTERWVYEGKPVPLVEGHVIRQGQSILTGTPGGVIFQAPATSFMLSKIASWLITFKFIKTDMMDYLVEEYVAKHLKEKTHLHPGDIVDLRGRYLGDIRVAVAEVQ